MSCPSRSRARPGLVVSARLGAAAALAAALALAAGGAGAAHRDDGAERAAWAVESRAAAEALILQARVTIHLGGTPRRARLAGHLDRFRALMAAGRDHVLASDAALDWARDWQEIVPDLDRVAAGAPAGEPLLDRLVEIRAAGHPFADTAIN